LNVSARLPDDLQYGQTEGARFTAARFGGHEHVTATQDQRYRLRLDVGRQVPFHFFDRFRQFGQHTHFFESRHCASTLDSIAQQLPPVFVSNKVLLLCVCFA
jgi:hypothetical protein